MSKWMLWSLLACATVASAGRPICQKDLACVETEMSPDGAKVYVKTFSDTPVTLTVFLNAHNLDTSKYGVITRIFGHKGRFPVAELKPLEADKPFNIAPKMAAAIGRLDALHDETHLYRLPFQPGHSHKVIQGWDGELSHHDNSRFCVDFAMPEGSPVVAARSGRVADVVDSSRVGGPDKRFAKHANYVVVLHDDGTTGEYYHLQYGSARVHVGDYVAAGTVLAASGSTGFSTMPHLHFGVYVASDWGQTVSVPTHFVSEDGIHRQLYEGVEYTASDHEDLMQGDAKSIVAIND